jgi:hypothetical protein
VDLAGSERVAKTRSEGAVQLREAGHINKSLSVLEQVWLVHCRVAKQKRGRETGPEAKVENGSLQARAQITDAHLACTAALADVWLATPLF